MTNEEVKAVLLRQGQDGVILGPDRIKAWNSMCKESITVRATRHGIDIEWKGMIGTIQKEKDDDGNSGGP